MNNSRYFIYHSPLGSIKIESNGIELLSVMFKDEIEMPDSDFIDEPAKKCKVQLDEYFSGERKSFDLPLVLNGTPFSKQVWKLLLQIPYGKTISYSELAKRYGEVKSIRAVASANGRNPFAVIIPCHRVIGQNGALTGYAGKLWRKQCLLEHELKWFRQLSLFEDNLIQNKMYF